MTIILSIILLSVAFKENHEKYLTIVVKLRPARWSKVPISLISVNGDTCGPNPWKKKSNYISRQTHKRITKKSNYLVLALKTFVIKNDRFRLSSFKWNWFCVNLTNLINNLSRILIQRGVLLFGRPGTYTLSFKFSQL